MLPCRSHGIVLSMQVTVSHLARYPYLSVLSWAPAQEVAKVVLQAFALRDNTVMEEITLQARLRPLHWLGSSLTWQGSM